MYSAELRVDTERWHFGQSAADKDAYIFNSATKKLDILGFILEYLGVPFKLLDKTRLVSVSCHDFLGRNELHQPPFSWLTTRSHADTEDTLELIRMNDDPMLTEEERRAKIKKFLNVRSINVLFLENGRVIVDAKKAETKSAPTITEIPLENEPIRVNDLTFDNHIVDDLMRDLNDFEYVIGDINDDF